MYNIRKYTKDEYQMVLSWWIDQNEVPPTKDMMPEESTFILESEDGTPWISITLYLVNTKEFVWIDNLISNPNIKSIFRKDAVKQLVDYIEDYSRKLGYKKTFCMSYKQPLTERYQDLGYTITCSSITTFIKEL